MYLFFDTETTGLPKSWKAPMTDLDNWPRVIQLGMALYDADKKLVQEWDLIIKPEGFVIPKDASAVHGITTERAEVEGILLEEAVAQFQDAAKRAKYLIAHNMSFDKNVWGAELLRSGEDFPTELEQLCTMLSTVNFCAIRGKWGNKWPKLEELHRKLFKKDFEDAHNALGDVRATANCFFELLRQNIIKLS